MQRNGLAGGPVTLCNRYLLRRVTPPKYTKSMSFSYISR